MCGRCGECVTYDMCVAYALPVVCDVYVMCVVHVVLVLCDTCVAYIL